MKDVRKLVPRTPPEGLLEWAAERHKELDQDGLLIETEWAQDWSLEVMLDEWAENRKVRAIRATCSACKESGLLWRGRDGRGEWGFIHPGTWTEGEGGEVCADGDKTTCPWCGESVIVRRKADVRKKGWFVAAERHVMSASVLGKDRLLTLTGWTVQRRITAAAGRQLVAIPAEAYEISANNAVALLEQSNHLGGIYTGQTVDELVAEICTIPYIIQSKFAGIKLYGWLPVATRRANLAQVLFAIGAHAKTDQNGVLRIESLWDGVSSSIPPDRIFWGDKVTYESKVTEVSVLEHQYIKGTEEVTLFEGVAEEGDIIQFEEPAYGLEASGFSVQSSGANYAVLSAGTGTLTGKKYVHMTRDVRVPVSEDEVSNVVEVKEATLVSLTNSAAVAQRLAGYYQYIEALDHEVVYDGERPGDVVAFEHPYGGESKGCIKDTAITMGGRLVASEQAVIGYVPPKFETEEVLDERVVLTGSGDYTVPEGVYTLTVVCIQAGTGAQAGFDGEPGGGTQLIVTTKEQDAGGSWSDTQADGGEGGQKGAPGAGGKVYRATIDVVPGQVIHYECGTPGVGGATNGAVGAAGGETTFGDLSSAQGASSEIGYVDPVTEEELAKPGTEGVDGAAGGRGGQASSRGGDYGENGEDVPPNTGGPGGPPYGWKFDDYTSENVRIYGGGAGGGAAHGKDGEPGSDSPTAVGGAGASPDVPKTPDKIGAGGNGGHGGGGGGGAGGLFASAEAYGPSELPAGIWITKDGGSAGKGSPGSNGGPGGVILYFGVRKKLVSGPIRDKSGRALLDRLGRRLIV